MGKKEERKERKPETSEEEGASTLANVAARGLATRTIAGFRTLQSSNEGTLLSSKELLLLLLLLLAIVAGVVGLLLPLLLLLMSTSPFSYDGVFVLAPFVATTPFATCWCC